MITERSIGKPKTLTSVPASYRGSHSIVEELIEVWKGNPSRTREEDAFSTEPRRFVIVTSNDINEIPSLFNLLGSVREATPGFGVKRAKPLHNIVVTYK